MPILFFCSPNKFFLFLTVSWRRLTHTPKNKKHQKSRTTRYICKRTNQKQEERERGEEESKGKEKLTKRRRSTAVWATINSNKHIQYTIYIHMFACVHVQYKPMIHRRLLSGSTIFRISKLEVDSRRMYWFECQCMGNYESNEV